MRWSVFLLVLGWAGALAAQPLALEECVARALRQNADVRLAEQGLRRSEADVQAARASRLPAADATLFGYGYSRTGSSVRVQENPTGQVDAAGNVILREEKTLIPGIARDAYSFSTSLNQTLYDAGRRANAHRAARHGQLGAEKRLEARRAEVVAGVKQRYYELLKALELVEVQEEAVTLSEKQLENARSRLEVGLGTEVDVLRLQVALGNTQAQLINARQGVALARANLNHIMGAEIRAPLEVVRLEEAEWHRSTVPDSAAGIVAGALARNPSLQRLREVAVATEHDLAVARGAWYPRVTGRLSYSRDNEIFDRVYQDLGQNYRLNLGVSMTYNLFDGGLKQANIARARVALETARMNAEEQERAIALAIETAHLEMTRLEKILRLGEQTIKLAQEDLRLAQERYRVGKGRLLEVLDAQVEFTRTRSNLVRTRYDLKMVEADLERLTGGE